MATSTPKPNHGTTVPDSLAVGPEHKSLADWRAQAGIDTSNQIKLVKLSHMRYQHPDLDKITEFLLDFGMTVAKRTDTEVWYRGYGIDPYVYYVAKGPKKFLGGTYVVESVEDLERACQLGDGATIKELSNAPGGGSVVTVFDPEGFPINLLHGQEPVPAKDPPQKITINYENDKPRVREFLRFQPGPAAVHKLGHYGLCVQEFQKQSDFYLKTFNLVPTDFLYITLPDGTKKDVAIFAHIDRGQDLVDHHTFFMSTSKTSHVHHSSFEVHDFDTQMLGHQWLAQKAYDSVWGVGRHILGSQVFDYWWDVDRNMIEHYADGDLVNDQSPIGYGPAGNESLAVWGPDVPVEFLD